MLFDIKNINKHVYDGCFTAIHKFIHLLVVQNMTHFDSMLKIKRHKHGLVKASLKKHKKKYNMFNMVCFIKQKWFIALTYTHQVGGDPECNFLNKTASPKMML